MKDSIVAALMISVTFCAAQAILLAGGQTASVAIPDSELARGIQLAREGEFDAAVIALDAVVQRLKAETRPRELAQAYTYLAVAYLGLGQEQTAKAKFIEGLRTDGTLDVSAREFPPRIVSLFEQARSELRAAPVPSPSLASTPPPVAEKKGKSKLPIVLLGVAGAGGVAVAAGGGGGGPATPPPATPPPATPPPVTTTAPTPPPTTTTVPPRDRQEIRRFDIASNSRTQFSFTVATGPISASLAFTPTGGGDMVFFLSRDGTNSVGPNGYAQGNAGSLRLDPGVQPAGEYFVVVANGSLTQRAAELRFNFISSQAFR